MTITDLQNTAAALHQPTAKAANEYEQIGDKLVSEMNELMKTRSDLVLLIGNGNTAMMEDNHRNHVRFLSSVFDNYQPTVLVETVLWVFRAYRSHGFQLTYWPAQLNQWVDLLKTNLSKETYSEIYPFYNWMIIHQATFVSESDKLVLTSKTPSH